MFAARGPRLAAMTVLCCVGTGCFHHKTQAVLPIGPPTQVSLASAPEPAKPPVITPVALTPTPVTVVKVPVQKKKAKKKTVVPPPAAPVQVASNDAPPAEARDVIGALTAGGDMDPAKKQRAADLIGELEKRLAVLPTGVLDKQKDGVARVRYFWKEARTALDSGDADGAVTLATKAKLLLDDLVKST
jgi:hypothetical protein